MKFLRSWLLASMALGLGACNCNPVTAPAGGPGEGCAGERPCAEGLSCVDAVCVANVVDAGSADAETVDGAGQDAQVADSGTTDRQLADQPLLDRGFADTGSGDSADAGSTSDAQLAADGSQAADTGQAADAHPHPDATSTSDAAQALDAFSFPDVSLHRDHAHVVDAASADRRPGFDVWYPDVASRDLWFLRDGNVSLDGGLLVDVLGVDAAIGSYSGVAEDGVVCGGGVCSDTSASCCVNVWPSQSLSCDSSKQCSGANVKLDCDGREDCGNMQECCSRSLSTLCVARGRCYDVAQSILMCVNDQDCRGGFVCCASGVMAAYGLDIGWCQTSCQ